MEKSLGRALRFRRSKLGLTQEEVADRVAALGDDAIRQSDISRLERGEVQMPRLSRLEMLAEALETNVADLLIAAGWLDPQHLLEAASRQVPAMAAQPELFPDEHWQAVRKAYQHLIDSLDDNQAKRESFERRKAEFEDLVNQYEKARAEFDQVQGE